MHKFTFFDLESVWDQHLHESYRAIDPAAQPHVRLGSKRIFATAAFNLTLSDDGSISCEGMSSWTQHDHGDEEAVVRGLFDHLRANPDRVACAFGSVATDLPLVTLAAMEHGLTLPAQLLQRQSYQRSGPIRPHLDLGLQLKAAGKTWTHMTEVLLRLGLPATLMAGKKRVDYPTNPEAWAAARAHCELDTALLAIATMAWQRTQGQCNLDPKIASFVILDWLRRNRSLTQALQDKLAAVCVALADEISDRLMRAA